MIPVVIVNLIDLLVSRKLFASSPFPILASVALVWYFILDFWVTTTTFEDDPTEYRPWFFILDIVILITLFGSFHALWTVQNETYFFLTTILLILWFGVWNGLLGVFHRTDSFSQALVFSGLLCAIPAITSLWNSMRLIHVIAK